MFFHLSVFLYSLLFFGGLELLSSETVTDFLGDLYLAHFWFFVALILLVLGYIYRTALRIGRRKELTPIPVLLSAAILLLLYFIDSPLQKHVFAALTALAYYFLHIGLYRLRVYAKDKTARAVVSAGAVAAIFLFYSGAYGIYLNFNLPLWILMLVFLLVTALVSYQYFFLLMDKQKEAAKYSLLLGFVMMEIAWAINFWPFGYLTTGVVTLIFYYIFWDVVQAFFLGVLTKKRLLGDLIFSGLLITIVLLTSRWVAVV